MKLKTLLLSLFLGNLYCSGDLNARPLPEHIYAAPPLSFIENKGQVTDQYGNSRPDIQFKLGSPGLNIFVGAGQIHYQWAKPVDNQSGVANPAIDAGGSRTSDPDQASSLTSSLYEGYRMDVTLIGAGKPTKITTQGQQDYRERYYLPQFGGKDNIARSYQKITYENVYPNIDWVLYIKNGYLEYDFVVKPGGNIADIRLKYSGASSLEIDVNGDLTAVTPMGNITERAPYSFLENGTKVASSFTLKDKEIGFKTGDFNPRSLLTIDPTIHWTSYYGGSGLDMVNNITCDASGNVYATGNTQGSGNIATVGSHQEIFKGGLYDVFLAKFNSKGQRVWATYYGGPDEDQGRGITFDRHNGIYLCGSTRSAIDIATANSYQATYGGSQSAFLAKFDTAGVRHWATYYGGGSTSENSYAVTCDTSTNVYMVGTTKSLTGIATASSYQPAFGGGVDHFIVKFDSSGTRQWGTYYGDTKNEMTGCSITYDYRGCIYVAALTQSTDKIATANGFQTTLGGVTDAYVAKFNEAGQRQWATYYGGPNSEYMLGNNLISTDDSGNVYLGFHTNSLTGIATTGSHPDALVGRLDCGLVKFDADGKRQWATYYGGLDPAGGPDQLAGILCDDNYIYLTGYTRSPDGIATSGQDTILKSDDAFLTKFDNAGVLQWGTYYGGSSAENTYSIAMDGLGSLYICGITQSKDLPGASNSFQDTFAGLADGFLVKFCAYAPNIPYIIGPDSVCANSVQVYSVPGDTSNSEYVWQLPMGWEGNNSGGSITITAGNDGSTDTLRVSRINCGTDTSEVLLLPVNVISLEPAVITINGFVLGTAGAYASYQWFLDGAPVANATADTLAVAANGSYFVIVTNEFGCADTSDVYKVTNYSRVNDLNNGQEAIRIYPNPAQDILNIESYLPLNVTICSMEGRVLLHVNDVKAIDVSNLAAGNYLLKFTDRNGIPLKTEMFIKW